LAPLSTQRQNISDYFKEAVAVVTNPAVDREREVEHFSTQTILGTRPPLIPGALGQAVTLTFDSPIGLDDSKYRNNVTLSASEGSLPSQSETLRSTQSDTNIYEHISGETGFTTLNKLTQQFTNEQVTEIQTVTWQ